MKKAENIPREFQAAYNIIDSINIDQNKNIKDKVKWLPFERAEK